MEALFITLFALVFVVLLKISGKTRQERFLDTLPGPGGYPFIGNFLDIFKTRQNYIGLSIENEAKYGGIYKTWIGSKPIVHISKAKYVEAVFNAKGTTRQCDENSLIIKSLKFHPFRTLKNKNIASSAVNSMTPQSVIGITNDNCKILKAVLREKHVFDRECLKSCVVDCVCGKGYNIFVPGGGSQTARCPAFSSATSHSGIGQYPRQRNWVADIILGVKVNSQSRQNESFANSLIKLNKLTEKNERARFYLDSLFRITSFGKEYFHHLKIVKDFIRKIIEDKKNVRIANREGNERKSVLSDLLLFSGLYTTEDIEYEVLNMIMSTLEPIESSIYFTLCVLGHQSNVQEELRREIQNNSTVKGNNFSTIENLRKMIYLDRVIKETLRLFPPCPFIVQELERDTKIASYLIPHGSTICIQVVNLHRDPESFNNREHFDPDNFLPKKYEKRNRFAYVPYGIPGGSCIGQKLTEIVQRIILINLVRDFKIETTENINSNIASVSSYVRLLKSEIDVRFSPREDIKVT